MASNGCPDYVTPPFKPDADGLACGAALANAGVQGTLQTADLPVRRKGWQDEPEPSSPTCVLTLRIAFFFDGTGNNRDVDEPTLKNSNVARLYRAHALDQPSNGIYHFYIPGVGTPFADIGDPGGGSTELAMGKGGDARIDWAIQQLEKVIAKHPAGKTIESIHVAAFGFSRGAAEARAFAHRVQAKCQNLYGLWYWKPTSSRFHFYFLGLFDTVASVGLVPTPSIVGAAEVAKKWMSLDGALAVRRVGGYGAGTGLRDLAFGAKPGANPAEGSVGDGHASWGDHMAIAAVVEKCVHFVAMHEQRNSFACDSVRAGKRYPDTCHEYVYPGMHSDVGGGYEPGEQGRSLDDTQKVSQLALLHMHALAVENRVPLQGVAEIENLKFRAYFQLAPKLHQRWQHYMEVAGTGGRPLGDMALAHTRLWYQWRFHRIHAYLDAIQGNRAGDTLPNEDDVRKAEAGFAQQRAAAKDAYEATQRDPGWAAAKASVARAEQDLLTAQRMQAQFGSSGDVAAKRAAYESAKAAEKPYEDRNNQARAKLDAVPGGGAAKAIQTYDLALLKDVAYLKQQMKLFGARQLRPHYRMLLDAYDAEFSGRGLKDQEIIAFFNEYIHDSLAGFAKDLTLASDPRIFFDGGNSVMRYARNSTSETGQPIELADSGIGAEPEVSAG